jgi:hypothetical protein
VHVDLEVLEGLAVSQPAGDIRVIFKLLYRTIHNIRSIAGKHSELPRMHAKPNVKITGQLADAVELPLTKRTYAARTPIITPSRLSVNRQHITANTNHSETVIKAANTLYQSSESTNVM